MNLVSVLESLAPDTWERLRDAQDLDVRFGDPTNVYSDEGGRVPSRVIVLDFGSERAV
jgi:hypothetical protein